jgi:RNase P subunit RPR2
MSTQQQGDRPMPPVRAGRFGMSKMKNPPCPKCARAMTVKQVMPVLFAPNVDDVIFGCEDCGTEAKHSVKRD